ncbi:O-acetyl-ADP-ribose deacetylase [bacterium HR30]|nr:O-acetyl-ADP-ribose deacetylase [bacterium HR30]
MREARIGTAVIQLVQGDITQQDTEAIVNAANRSLRGGGGVDGAIHRAGGPQILEECKKLGGCETGDAKTTSGGRLKAKYVIHAVGPIYRGGKHGEAELLASAYRRSLEEAAAHNVTSIAFPSISTGAYGYPIEEASRIALETVMNQLPRFPGIKLVRFVLFTKNDLQVYETQLDKILASQQR